MRLDSYVPRSTEAFLEFSTYDRDRSAQIAIEVGEQTFPDSPSCKATLAFARQHLHPAILNHSIRTYLLSHALLVSGFPSGTNGVEQVELKYLQEKLFLASLLHDSGTSVSAPGSQAGDPEAHMSFEFTGGFVAYKHLRGLGDSSIDPATIGDIVESIFIHTGTFDSGHCTAIARVIRFAVSIDVLGWDSSPVNAKIFDKTCVEKIESAWPRLGFSDVFGGMMEKECRNKGWCLTSQKEPEKYFVSIKRVDTLMGGGTTAH